MRFDDAHKGEGGQFDRERYTLRHEAARDTERLSKMQGYDPAVTAEILKRGLDAIDRAEAKWKAGKEAAAEDKLAGYSETPEQKMIHTINAARLNAIAAGEDPGKAEAEARQANQMTEDRDGRQSDRKQDAIDRHNSKFGGTGLISENDGTPNSVQPEQTRRQSPDSSQTGFPDSTYLGALHIHIDTAAPQQVKEYVQNSILDFATSLEGANFSGGG